jgi:dolichyl-phosphate beta-glucosyltransferase
MAQSLLVIPCFNEANRLDRAEFLALADAPQLDLLFVDDGSKDATLTVLEELQSQAPGRIHVLPSAKNRGKGEAVRIGLLEALDRGYPVVGFADADLATPRSELVRLRDELEKSDLDVAVGSRVMLMGTRIERHLSRHLVGRLFATFAANILAMPFYDTQCGAKFFKDAPALRAALQDPFHSRWAFDIELLGRIHIGTHGALGIPSEKFREVPLNEWIAVDGSKLSLTEMTRTLLELMVVDRELKRLRASAHSDDSRRR